MEQMITENAAKMHIVMAVQVTGEMVLDDLINDALIEFIAAPLTIRVFESISSSWKDQDVRLSPPFLALVNV